MFAYTRLVHDLARKKLAAQQCDIANYLSLQAGEVVLFNASIDFVAFKELADLAEIHQQDQAPWLANALRFTAIKCWEGFFDSDLSSLVLQTKFRAQDVRTYREICARLASTTLLSDGDVRILLERLLVLQAQESESLEVTKSLVLLYRQIGDVAGIYNTKRKLAEGLQSIDIVAEEAATLLSSLD